MTDERHRSTDGVEEKERPQRRVDDPERLREELNNLKLGKADNGIKQQIKIWTPVVLATGGMLMAYGSDREKFDRGTEMAEENREAVVEMKGQLDVISMKLEDQPSVEEIAERLKEAVEDEDEVR